ncbi:hypothetical protein B0A48_15990 [Cryoendolithus antarcticus]|uniref:Uncharacterized protein n=1 Tax=Cryoendolithus antarcticus TaxID=1507870 RepID=A0A1V8SG86_9PEZI|nr:hypothetical protein B0A48_15990 [Cryoendolithus antarcticus]
MTQVLLQTNDTKSWTSASSAATPRHLDNDVQWPATTVLRSEHTGLRFTHPCQISVGKPYPMIVVGTEKFLHHQQNGFLQTLIENYSQGTHCIGLLPVMGEAAEIVLESPSVLELPTLDYPTAHAGFYAKLHRMCDNSYRITGGIPYTLKRRVSPKPPSGSRFYDEITYPHLQAMLKSCKWDFNIMLPSQRYIITRAAMHQFAAPIRWDGKPRKRFDASTGENADRIMKNNAALVKPKSQGGKFNKFDLELVLNDDGSIWTGRIEERPDDADLSLHERESRARLWTLDEECDDDNEIDESDETLYFEDIIQTLETGGKDPHTGIKFSIISGHPLVYSWGRGLHRRDAADKKLGIIGAGDRMQTGCTTLHHTDIANEYDWARRTIVKELWTMDRGRAAFPLPDDDMKLILQQMVLMKHLDPAFCDPVGATADGYPDVVLSKSSWKAIIDAQKSAQPPLDDDAMIELWKSARQRAAERPIAAFDDALKQSKKGDDDLEEQFDALMKKFEGE